MAHVLPVPGLILRQRLLRHHPLLPQVRLRVFVRSFHASV